MAEPGVNEQKQQEQANKNKNGGVFDISWPLKAGATSWKNSEKDKLVYTSMRQWVPDKARSSLVSMSLHTGTHCDAPSHFVEHGVSIEHVSWRQMCGPCVVLDLTHPSIAQQQLVKKADLLPFEHAIQPGTCVLLKTANSQRSPSDSFDLKFVALAQCGAAYLAERGVKCVGIDYLGIERSDFQPGHETHNILLGKNIAVIEGLRLADVPALQEPIKTFDQWCALGAAWPPGKQEALSSSSSPSSAPPPAPAGVFRLVCLPINMVGVEAAPARALLFPLDADLRTFFA